MPEPKKTKRTYKAQANSSLDGVRLVQQRPAPANRDGSDSLLAGEGQPPTTDNAPGPELVRKLIHFIKSI